MGGLKTSAKLTVADDYLPVIVLTAEPAHKLRALKCGARDFISKPFDLVEVKTRIHNMLEVRLLYKRIEEYNRMLKQTVRERTARLILSDELVATLQKPVYDWHWEQNKTGQVTTVSGPIHDIVGLRVSAFFGVEIDEETSGWSQSEKKALQKKLRLGNRSRDLNLAVPMTMVQPSSFGSAENHFIAALLNSSDSEVLGLKLQGTANRNDHTNYWLL